VIATVSADANGFGAAAGVATVLIVAPERALIGGEVNSASASVSSSER
jgi:hypothetical protein